MKVRMRGLAALDRKLAALGRAATKAEDDALERGAELIAERARTNAAYRTGALRESMGYSRGKANRKTGESFWRAGTNLWRAHFVEFGTANAPEQPFLIPSFEALRNRIANDLVRSRVKAALRQVAR